MDYIKPKKLKEGDTVAFITLSWGGAFEYKDKYETGKRQLEETFKLKVIETPNALKSPDWIYSHPEERLNDLIWAFKNPEVKAIISIIGGDDSIRLLDFLKEEHLAIIKNNPKIFIGFSDSTVTHLLCLKAGLLSFYGPSVLFGFAENGGIDDFTKKYFEKALFSEKPIGGIKNNEEGWTLDRVPWKKEYQDIKRKMQEPVQIKFIQGKGEVEGNLIGGCADVLEIIKGTKLWPNESAWNNTILFLETSEDIPSPNQFKYWLRNYGAQGILNKINGIIFGIPGGDIEFDDSEYEIKLKKHLQNFEKYERALLEVAKEYGREDLVIATNLQFGHIMPMMTIPYGIKIKLDAKNKEIKIIEAGVI
ncbi:MAG: LD-carboxypeptidase [Candidatus Nanoarchaeia archaeon]|nr:LD-carboxypeptidase [Candidatus Nanoarchaeia archaeon]|tara:strand:- start:27611 stop:28699 length:1089 start_codon:yes stop_codon:yes gene_type:complete